MFVNGVATPINIDGVRWDRRCGPDYPSIQDGVTSGKCDPNGPNPCCSEFGWCGPESDYNSRVLLRRQILKRQLSRQMFVI